jgi:hypothetical protein
MSNILNTIKEHYKLNNVSSPFKARYCNLSGEEIKDKPYIRYKSGETYLEKYLEKYITFITNQSDHIIEHEKSEKEIIVECGDIKITFDLTFDKSFHSYVDHPYSDEVDKYLIYGVYGKLSNTKPYFRVNELKLIKKNFKHGDIVSTGENHYILKNAKMKNRTWKKIECYFDDSLFIEFQYVQSRGYLYYIELSKHFDIHVLPLDGKNDEMYDIRSSSMFESNPEQYTDEILDDKPNTFLDVAESENKEHNENKNTLNREYGKVIRKEDDYYICFDDTNHVKIDENIPRQFIYIRGHVYYHNICREFKKEWKCLVSPFEVLNLGTGGIGKIKL